MKKPEYRSVDFSRTTITELMIPAYSNFGGKIHGGIILSLMDKAAYACAARHAGEYCVTASMNAVDFLAPVEVGELVSLHASVNYVGSSSIVVGVRVESQKLHSGELKHTNSCYFTMVAMGEDRKPKKVPGLILETKQDIRRFIEAIKRKRLIKIYKQEAQELRGVDIAEEYNLLEGERCMVIDDQ